MVIEIHGVEVIYNLIPSLRSPEETYRENVLASTMGGNAEWIICKEAAYGTTEDNDGV